MNFIKAMCLVVVVIVVFTGCGANQSSQSNGGPTVSGYISTGAHKQF